MIKDHKREHELKELLFASGIVDKSEEIRLTPPDEAEKTIWEERTFQTRSTYVRTRERHGAIIKPPKIKNDTGQKLLSTVSPETNDLYKFRYWIKKSLSGENQNKAMFWNDKGNELFNRGRYDEAVKCYDQAIVIDPYSSVSWNNKGAALHDMGKPRDALKCYDMALKINEENAVAWIGKGAVLHSLKKHDQALACYDKAIEINPMLSDAWYNRAMVLKKLGHKERAEENLQRAKEIESNR